MQGILGAAAQLKSGDLFILSYSGHGGQVQDRNNDEGDRLDETWVLFDRILLDDELYLAWSAFEDAVRIVFFSDSCHSGTIARARYDRNSKLAPPIVTLFSYNLNRPEFGRLVRGKDNANVRATVLSFSACKDDQLAIDGEVNGMYTMQLLKVYDDGAFSGDYIDFESQIVARMPANQVPSLLVVGPANQAFQQQIPFTVASPEGSIGDGDDRPIVGGPASIPRSGPPPQFVVTAKPFPFFVFEITTDPGLFDTARRNGERGRRNFYGSWQDDYDRRYTGSLYTLTETAWADLRTADRLYYRVAVTASDGSWSGYRTSTDDGEAQQAPTLAVVEGDDLRPIVAGPASVPRSGPPPIFLVVAKPFPFFVFEITTDPGLFDTARRNGERRRGNFYGSWQEDYGRRYTGSLYTLTETAWADLRTADRLYYRVAVTASDGSWSGYTTSTDDSEGGEAPYIVVSGKNGADLSAAT